MARGGRAYPQSSINDELDCLKVGDLETDIERVKTTFDTVHKLKPEEIKQGDIDAEQWSHIKDLTEMGYNYDETISRVQQYFTQCLQAFGKYPFADAEAGMSGRHGKFMGGMGRFMHPGGYPDDDFMGGGHGGFGGRLTCFHCREPFRIDIDKQCKTEKGSKTLEHVFVPGSLVQQSQSNGQQLSSLQSESSRLQSQIDDLTKRLQAEMGVKQGDDNAVKINLKLTPTSLTARYNELCTKEREEARKEITVSKEQPNGLNEEEALILLCRVLEVSDEVTKKVVQNFRSEVEQMILNPSSSVTDDPKVREELRKQKWSAEHDRALNELLRSVSSDVNIENLVQEVKKDLRKPDQDPKSLRSVAAAAFNNLKVGSAFQNYINESVYITWVMALQTPPMRLSVSGITEAFNQNFQEENDGRHSSKGKMVQFYLYPTLRQGGSIASKGKVQLG